MGKVATGLFATLLMMVGFSATASAQSNPLRGLDQAMAGMERGLDAMFGGPVRAPARGGGSGAVHAYDGHGGGYYAGQDMAANHDWPYSNYRLLNAEERQIYDWIYPAMANAEPGIVLYTSAEESSLQNAILAVRRDYPEYVWLTDGYEYTRKGRRLEITFRNNELARDPARYQVEFYRAAERILAMARQKNTKLEQERVVYEYLLTENIYRDHDLSRTAYAPLVMGSAVCVGFALAMQYLLQQLDIPTYVVGNPEHVWVIAQIEGWWYVVDATTPQNDHYRFPDRAAIDDFERKNFNVGYDEFSSAPDMSKFPNSRLF